MKRARLLFVCLFISCLSAVAQSIPIAVLEYSGGGDWYANPTALKNLAQFTNQQCGTRIDVQSHSVAVASQAIFNYPFIHMTGHGRWELTAAEVSNLRDYLLAGGFLHIDDNYGLDAYVRPEMKKVFPELNFVEVPFNHPIYSTPFAFPKGLPKIHQHDNASPRGFGLFYENKLICFYSYETDLGDGWEDEEVHHDAAEKRIQALKMGANLIHYAFTRFLN
ncbi:MAG: hypothetical protein RLZ39_1827 [Bacteroidota bacterium]|jgi:hypothetical protein